MNIHARAIWTLFARQATPVPKMTKNPAKHPETPASKAAAAREQRLKAALKANMGRRKAQARAKARSDTASANGSETGTKADANARNEDESNG